MTHRVKLRINDRGQIRMIHDDGIDLSKLGTVELRRASHVEPRTPLRWWQWRRWLRLRHIPIGKWYADLSPVKGPVLGPFDFRRVALAAEYNWLEDNWL